MAALLISDTSILIDLERGDVAEAAFRTSHELAVPDVLFKRELEPYNGAQLRALGLKVLPLEPSGVGLAAGYRVREPKISFIDSMALALAKATTSILLTGDAALRALADQETVECHGLLWLFDVFENEATLEVATLHAALTRIRDHPNCRLPRHEVDKRLAHYTKRME
jgi:predicted nucleic acid-binding protein